MRINQTLSARVRERNDEAVQFRKPEVLVPEIVADWLDDLREQNERKLSEGEYNLMRDIADKARSNEL